MPKKQDKKRAVQKHHHLTPLEVQAIFSAHARGARAVDLATQHGVSRQSIHAAIRTIARTSLGETTVEGNREGIAPPPKHKRSRRILPEVAQGIADMKRKYPAWGVAYIREHWINAGNPSISIQSIYRILRDAGLQTRELVETEVYQRFEMTRPGQLWQMDIQGKIYLTGIGWVHGFAILDDFSRFCPGFHYFPDELLSNGILLLNEAIGKHGVPDRLYTDNGSQFASRGDRLNNFELFCAAYNISITHTLPGKPSGKGKIERFYETVENQFITWARATIKDLEEGSTYPIDQLNHDLETYIQEEYHVRVHGMTHETPVARFFQESLRAPDPIVDVRKFLERTTSKPVNKCGEVSFKGYKIQVGLPGKTRITVVETIETVRIEQGEVLVREINKKDLSKALPVKRQDGNTPHEEKCVKAKKGSSKKELAIEPAANEQDDDQTIENVACSEAQSENLSEETYHARKISKHSPNEDGFYHRPVLSSGNFRVLGGMYHLGRMYKYKNVLVQVVENTLRVFDEEGNLLKIIDIHARPVT